MAKSLITPVEGELNRPYHCLTKSSSSPFLI